MYKLNLNLLVNTDLLPSTCLVLTIDLKLNNHLS